MNTIVLPLGTADDKSKDESLNLFRQRGEPKDYPPETELFRQGQPIRDVCLIERGLVKFTCAGKKGREVVVMLRSPGDLLGVAAVISNLAPHMTASTLTECQISCISAGVFLNLLDTDIEFSRYIQKTGYRQYYEQMGRMAQLATASARTRLARLLLQLVPESGDKSEKEIRLDLQMSKANRARVLAMSPEHLSRMFTELEEMGIIRRGSKGLIYVRNLALLSQEAE